MLSDQPARDRFQNILSENFSVIASPGTGKTTAITHRIANVICQCKYPERLKTFLAVTYTEKAANEIKERVTKTILKRIEQHSAPHYATVGLNNIFFGTIHSLCAHLLRQHGAQLSVHKDFEVIEDDSKYWKIFTQNSKFLEDLSETERQVLPYFALDKILEDAHVAKPHDYENFQPILLDESSITDLLNYPASVRETSIKNFQDDLKIWIQTGQNCPIPPLPRTSSKSFWDFLSNDAKGFVSWQEKTYEHLVNIYANWYQQFRISNNILTYDDLINLALKLLTDKRFENQNIANYQVLLDEAQDTDPDQFKILIALANRDCYKKIFENANISTHPSTFSFSMVGDPKQSIYSDRANVAFYMFVHDAMIRFGLSQPLNFNITMRCDREIVSFANDKFVSIFSMFSDEPMQARPSAENGAVDIIKTDNNFETLTDILSTDSLLFKEVKKCSDIAILSPRKAWLEEIITQLKHAPQSPKLQLWASENIANQPSLIKWSAAILHYLFLPTDKEEFAGILREIFGISTDKIIAHINHGEENICSKIDGEMFQLRQQAHHLHLPNIARSIIEQFRLIERIKILDLYSQEKIVEHMDIIMDTAYECASKNLDCRALEEKLIYAYQHLPSNIVVDEKAVQLLTYHKSKGLEWPVVILPFLYREHKLSSSEQTEIDNERRMLFVACTRAKHRLILLDDSICSVGSDRTNMISSGKFLDKII